jgi:hypothetical protein
MSADPAEPVATPSSRPPYGMIAAVAVVLLVLLGGFWFWRSNAANAAEAAARKELEAKEILLVAEGPHVRTLNSMKPIDDATFAKIGDLHYLQSCVLSGSEVTDAQLAVLANVGSLLNLVIDHSPGVTSAGLAHLQGHGSLEKLFAGNTSIDDAGVAHLSGMPSLNTLDISYNKITDAGMAHLVDIPKLEVLRICGTEVTDAGVESLKQITSLRDLNIAGTKITADGVKALRAANKDLVIKEEDGGGR